MLSRRRMKFTKSACAAVWEWLSKAPIAPYTKNQGARPARRPTHTGDREGVTTGNDHARPKGRRACKEANTHGRPRGAVTHDPQSCKHSTCTGDREGS
jgi:hypothetical protein